MIIDSHCHLEYEPMYSQLSEVVQRGIDNNVKYFLSISTTDASFQKILKIIDQHQSIYGTYGIHPHETKNYASLKSDQIINKVRQNSKIIGIGETGLDFYYNHSEKKDQINSFEEHISAAQKKNLPLIVHTRSAENDTYEILRKYLSTKDLKILHLKKKNLLKN